MKIKIMDIFYISLSLPSFFLSLSPVKNVCARTRSYFGVRTRCSIYFGVRTYLLGAQPCKQKHARHTLFTGQREREREGERDRERERGREREHACTLASIKHARTIEIVVYYEV